MSYNKFQHISVACSNSTELFKMYYDNIQQIQKMEQKNQIFFNILQ